MVTTAADKYAEILVKRYGGQLPAESLNDKDFYTAGSIAEKILSPENYKNWLRDIEGKKAAFKITIVIEETGHEKS